MLVLQRPFPLSPATDAFHVKDPLYYTQPKQTKQVEPNVVNGEQLHSVTERKIGDALSEQEAAEMLYSNLSRVLKYQLPPIPEEAEQDGEGIIRIGISRLTNLGHSSEDSDESEDMACDDFTYFSEHDDSMYWESPHDYYDDYSDSDYDYYNNETPSPESAVSATQYLFEPPTVPSSSIPRSPTSAFAGSSSSSSSSSKRVRFNGFHSYYTTYGAFEYDRSEVDCIGNGRVVTNNAVLKSIRRELNEFKMLEMEVHKESRENIEWHFPC
ncbi:hypothetical protein BKA69DRAFT_1128015 [Paraphysoderma sedebokerense]|nr:hypothetical protein BKA69DRAFT_1128015 [Paraphysoderma sedebokerense]